MDRRAAGFVPLLLLISAALLVVPALAETIHGVDVGHTVLLKERTQTSNCTLGTKPDRQCSPGAYYSALTKKRICAADFRTDPIRLVPQSEKEDVEQEYGLPVMKYGKTLEIDTSSRSSSAARTISRTSFPRSGTSARATR